MSLPAAAPADPALDLAPDLTCRISDWQITELVEPSRFRLLRRTMMLEHCKWDPQVGDQSTLSPFALSLPRRVIGSLFGLAERLAAELQDAETWILNHPELIARLGLSRLISPVLSHVDQPPTPAAARVVRVDFHPTAEGWRISEANADVPGGYTESGPWARLMAGVFDGLAPLPDPAVALVRALVEHVGPGHVGIVVAAGFMEDHQVVAYLSQVLRAFGIQSTRLHPRQVRYGKGPARCEPGHSRTEFDALIRFYQGEWLHRTGPRCDWEGWFRGGSTPVVNPGSSLVVESKRFPLVWPLLPYPLPTWRALLPETRTPHLRDGLASSPEWVLKPAFGNNGDDVLMGRASPRLSERLQRGVARLRSGLWVEQRRFHVTAISTPVGPMYPCLGVYTVNGRAAGIYGRLARGAVIDYQAIDVAVLTERPSECAAS